MKLQLLSVSKGLIDSLSERHYTMPDVNNRWRYHPEVELVYFKKGHGTQSIGNNVSPFETGNIVLISTNPDTSD